MPPSPTPPAALDAQLAALGVRPGMTLQTHTSFSRVGPVDGGPAELIAALRRAVGPDGTLVMPALSEDDDTPFDPATSPCPAMGVVADTFRRLPDALRSDSPHSFAAAGPLAASIAAPHGVERPHGPDSPVGRVRDAGGSVLLLGVGHEANTTCHLAEEEFGVAYRRPAYATVRRNGASVRVDYTEPDHCCGLFALVDAPLDASGAQRRGVVGRAEARLVPARAVVAAATTLLRANPTAFLHPPTTDPDCDLAWAALNLLPL